MEYEKTFSAAKKSSKGLDKAKEVKNTLEKALNKKEVKIENPNYIVEEEKNSKKTMNSKKIEKSTVHDSDNLEKREYNKFNKEEINPSDALPKKEKHMKKELSPSAPLNKNNSKRPLSVSDSDEEEEAVVETKLVDRSQPIKKDEKLEKSKQKKSSYENENTSKKQMEKDQEKPKAKKNVDSNKVQEKTFEKIKPKNPKEEKSEEDEHNPTIQLDRSKKNTISKENVDDTEKFDKKKGKNKHKITQPNKSDSSDSDYYLNKNPTLAIDRNKKKAQPPIKNDDSKDSSDGKYKKPTLKNDDVKKPENPTLAIDRNKKNGQPQNTNDDSDDDVDEKNKEPTVQRNDLKKYEEKKIEEKLDNDFPAKTKKQDSRAEKQKELSDVQHLTIGKSKQFSMQGKKEEKYDPEMTNIKKEKLKEDSDEDENEKYGTITSRPETTNAVEKTEINLRVINQHSQISSTTFPCDFTIYRDPKLFNNIFLEDPDHAISRKHAQVILLKDKGFFLQDRGSSNHTFLRIHHFTRVTLDEGIELLFGNSLFKILSIKEGMVTMESTPNYILNCSETKKIKFKIKARLFFGRDPIKGENSNDTFSVFNDDQSIEKTHVIFHYSAGKVQLEPKKTTFGFKLLSLFCLNKYV